MEARVVVSGVVVGREMGWWPVEAGVMVSGG